MMAEFTEELFVSSSTLIVDKNARIVANTMELGSVPGLTVNITEASAYAKELVRRYNSQPDLNAALKKAVNLIKRFHGMGEGHKDIAEESWKLYYENAPEMKPIKAALAKAEK